MDLQIFILGGYGHYVWPAFIFTFASCFVLYLKTKKSFERQSKLFLNEFRETKTDKIKLAKIKKTSRESLSVNPIF